jgi:hypothetical protein
MNIVVIHDTGVDVYKSWREVEKWHSFKKEDFTKVGTDYVLNVNGESYEISKDIKLLERVASERVFAKQSMSLTDWAAIGSFFLILMTYFKLG